MENEQLCVTKVQLDNKKFNLTLNCREIVKEFLDAPKSVWRLGFAWTCWGSLQALLPHQTNTGMHSPDESHGEQEPC